MVGTWMVQPLTCHCYHSHSHMLDVCNIDLYLNSFQPYKGWCIKQAIKQGWISLLVSYDDAYPNYVNG